MATSKGTKSNKATPDEEVEQFPVTPAMSEKAKLQITKAVSATILDDPFYGALLLRMEMIEDNKQPTACTNGKYIKYNARFIHDMPLSQIKGLLRHEVAHVAQLHHLRRQQRQPGPWNYACDAVINAIGKEAGWDLPPGGVDLPQHKDHSAEHVYSMLPEMDGIGAWNWGGVEDAEGSEDESIRKQLEMDTITEVLNAANAAKLMGKLPAHVERMIEKIAECKLPWRELLARFFKSIAKDDFSWNHPNRRYMQDNLYLPSLYSHKCGPVVLAIDTSGSIGQSELEEFIAELNGIVKHAQPSVVHVVYCDAEVQRTEAYRPGEDVRATKPKGGGGTAFGPVFDWVKKENVNPECLVYLTDMHGSFPETHPYYSTIWVSTSSVKEAPFGKVIRL